MNDPAVNPIVAYVVSLLSILPTWILMWVILFPFYWLLCLGKDVEL